MEIGVAKHAEMGVDHEDAILDCISLTNNVETGNSGELLVGDDNIRDNYLYDSTLLTEVKNVNKKPKIIQSNSQTLKNSGSPAGAPLVNGNNQHLKGYGFKVFTGTGNDTASLNLPKKFIPHLKGQSGEPARSIHDVNKGFRNGNYGKSDMVTLTFEPVVNGDSRKNNRNNNNVVKFSVSPNLSYITSLASSKPAKLVHNSSPTSRTKTFHASPDLSKSPNIANYRSTIKHRLLAMEKFRAEQKNNHFKTSATSMLKTIVALNKAPEKSGTFTCVSAAKKHLKSSKPDTNSIAPSRKRSYFGVSEHYFQYLNKPKRARHEPFQIMFKVHSLHPEISSTNAVKFPRASLSWPSGKVPLPGYKVPKRRICKIENIGSSKKRRTVATYRVLKPKPRQAQMHHFSRTPACGQRKVLNFKSAKLMTLNTLKWDPRTKKFVLQSQKPVPKLQKKSQFFSFPSTVSKTNAVNLAQRSSKALLRAQNAHKVSRFLSQVVHNTAAQSKTFLPKIPQNIKDVKNIFKCMHTPNPELFKSLNDYVRMCMLFHVRRQMAAKSLRSSYVEGKNKPIKSNIGTNTKNDLGPQKIGKKLSLQDRSKRKDILHSIVLLSLQTEQILTKWTNELPQARDIEKASVVPEPDRNKRGNATPSSCNWLYTCKGEYVEASPSNTSHVSGQNDDKLYNQAWNCWSYDCVEVTKPVHNTEAANDLEETTKTEPAVSTKMQNGALHNGNERSVMCVNRIKHEKSVSDVQIHLKMQRSRSQVRTLSRDDGSIRKTKATLPKLSYCVRFRSCFCSFQDEHYGKNCLLFQDSFPCSRITSENTEKNSTDQHKPNLSKSVSLPPGSTSMPCTSNQNFLRGFSETTLLDSRQTDSPNASTNDLRLLTKDPSEGGSSAINSHYLRNEVISLNGNESSSRCDYFKDHYGDVTEFRRKIGNTKIYYKWSVRRFSDPECQFKSPINFFESFQRGCRNKNLETVKRRVSADDIVANPNHQACVQPIKHKNMVHSIESFGSLTESYKVKPDVPSGYWREAKTDNSERKQVRNPSREASSRYCSSDIDMDGTNQFEDDDVQRESSEFAGNRYEDTHSKRVELEDEEMDSKMLDYALKCQTLPSVLADQNMGEETTVESLEGNKLFISFNSGQCSEKPNKDSDEKTVAQRPVACELNALRCQQSQYTAGKRLISTMAKSENVVDNKGSISLRKTTASDDTASCFHSCKGSSFTSTFMKESLDSGKPGSITCMNNVTLDAGIVSSALIGVNLVQSKHTSVDDAERNSLANGVPCIDLNTQNDDDAGAGRDYYKEMGNKLFRDNLSREVASASVTEQNNSLDFVDSDTALTDIGNKVCSEEINSEKMGIENRLTVRKGGSVDLCDELDTSGLGFNGKSSLRRLVKEATTGDAKTVCQSDVEISLADDTVAMPSVLRNCKVKPDNVASKFSDSKLNEDTKENVIETITQNVIEAERIASGDSINGVTLETRSSHRLRSRVSKKRGRYETDYVTDLPKTPKKPKRILPTRDYSNEEFWQFYRDCEKTEHAKNLALYNKYIKLIKSKEANCKVLPRFAAQSQYSNIICAAASLNNSRNVVPESGLMPFMSRHTRLKKSSVELPTAPENHCPYCGRFFVGNPKATYDSHVARHEMRYTILSAPVLTSSLKKIQSKAAKKSKYARKDPKKTRTATTVVYVDSMSRDLPKGATVPNNNTWLKSSPEHNKLLSNIPKTSNISMGHRKQTARKSFNLTATLPKEALIATLQCKMRLSSPPEDSKEPGSSVFNFQDTSCLNANPVILPKGAPLQLPKKPYLLSDPINNKLHTKTNQRGKNYQSCSKYPNKIPGTSDIRLHSVNNVVKLSYCKANDTNKNGPKSPVNALNGHTVSLIRKKSNDRTCNGQIRGCKRKLSNCDQTQGNKQLNLENRKVCLSRKNSRGK